MLTKSPASNLVAEALRLIADRVPRRENSIHGQRMRCCACGHVWITGGKETHGANCAYIIAKQSLATQRRFGRIITIMGVN